MSLCRRFFRQDLRLLGFSIPALMVRPLGQVTNPEPPERVAMHVTVLLAVFSQRRLD